MSGIVVWIAADFPFHQRQLLRNLLRDLYNSSAENETVEGRFFADDTVERIAYEWNMSILGFKETQVDLYADDA